MKKLMMTAALVTAFAGASAQESTQATKDPAMVEKRAAARADERTAAMTTELGLSAEQVTKVDAINERHAKAVAQLRQANLVGEALKERMKVLRQGRDNELKQVLTVEQFQKLMTLRKERKEDHDVQGNDAVPHNE